MTYKVISPAQVWEDFDSEKENINARINTQYKKEEYTFSSYYFDAIGSEKEQLSVSTGVYVPKNCNNKAILILQDYENEVQNKAINDFIEKGFLVVVPDYSGINKVFETVFPEKYAYGKFSKNNEHTKKPINSPKDTAQYLYSLIAKRAITFVQRQMGIVDIIIVGVDRGTEIAMQVAGSDNRLKALVLINGAGYYEYFGKNKYDKTEELEIDDEMLCWLSGVAAIAYAKNIKVPTLVTISSNGQYTDIDRITNLYSLMENSDVRVVISPRSSDNINILSYGTIFYWINKILDNKAIQKMPKINTSISDNMFYAEINVDNTEKIKECNLYYAFDEYDHSLRSWQKIACEKIGEAQYVSKVDIGKDNEILFLFCEAVYENFCFSSIQEFVDLRKLSIKEYHTPNNRIIYESEQGRGSFVERQKETIVFVEGATVEKTPIGLKGIQINKGSIINYEIGKLGKINSEKLLQIDLFAKDEKEVDIELFIKSENTEDKYLSKLEAQKSDGEFISYKFSPNQFKNDNMMPLNNWDDAKSISFEDSGIIIGKIMFV